MRNITTSILLVAGTIYGAKAQNVGIGTNIPASKLHVVQIADVNGVQIEHLGGAGNSILVDHLSANDLAFMTNYNDGMGINIGQIGAAGGAAVLAYQAGTAGLSRGLETFLDVGTVADGLGIFTAGTGVGGRFVLQETTNNSEAINVTHTGTGQGILISKTNAAATGAGIYVQDAGSGDGLVVEQQGTGWGVANFITGGGGVYNDLNSFAPAASNQLRAGGYGALTFMNGFDGWGYYVDSIAGDGYGFFSRVATATPTTGTTVSGAVFAGDQYGVGHGILINHRGSDGRNAEFNIENAANGEATIFATHNGTAPVIQAQNQATATTATISVGDFSYTGSDVDDHIGVAGSSSPAVDWGIGVQGTGNWYGVEGVAGSSGLAVFGTGGDVAATGVKSFFIDYPLDPANKFLRHYAIESDEVLNMYRGVVELDANGQATIALPEYFEAINKDYSYQLTAIGTPQQPYVLEEIANNEFKVAGAPNSKVSWTVHAKRNDPYMQQNEARLVDIIDKPVDRQGTYLTPELYNMPQSASLTPRYNTPEMSTSQMSTEGEPSAEKFSREKEEVNVEADKPTAQPSEHNHKVTMKE